MRILVTGAHGFLGKNLLHELAKDPSLDIVAPSRTECDLLNLDDCIAAAKGVDCIIHLATRLQRGDASVYDVFYENSLMNMNIIEAARQNSVKRLIATGTILMYRFSPSAPPYHEEDMRITFRPADKTEYIATKLTMLIGLRALHEQEHTHTIFVILPNLFGPHDAFAPGRAHFFPTAVAKIVEAKAGGSPNVVFAGQGVGKREFGYAPDVAAAIRRLLTAEGYIVVNVGSGDVHEPHEVAEKIAAAVGYTGAISFADGEADELFMDCAVLKNTIGDAPHTPFSQALRDTIAWYNANKQQ